MKNFQLIIIVVFIFSAIIGLLVFSGAIPLGNNNQDVGQGTVVLWGTVNASVMNNLIEEFNTANPTYVVQYVQKNANNFDQDLLEALASGIGPDMFFLTEDLVFRYSNKILAIPYESYPLSNFKNNFASAGDVFLTSRGILALPITIDPLVMYYNRGMLDTNGIVYPPSNWDLLVEMTPTLTKKDENNKINKSTNAFGHYVNISHAKNILATLFMQAGNKIISEQNGIFTPDLDKAFSAVNPSVMLGLYTSFANPQNSNYSWNRSLPNSIDFFITDNLAFYFGYASELTSIANKNPNLNFLVGEIPQIKNSNSKVTSAHVNGIAISAFSKNINTAFIAASSMSTGDFAMKLADSLKIVPARRDLLTTKRTDAYSPTFYKSALYARSWIDPSSKDTDNIFRGMIDGVLSNNLDIAGAIRDANAKLSLLLNR